MKNLMITITLALMQMPAIADCFMQCSGRCSYLANRNLEMASCLSDCNHQCARQSFDEQVRRDNSKQKQEVLVDEGKLLTGQTVKIYSSGRIFTDGVEEEYKSGHSWARAFSAVLASNRGTVKWKTPYKAIKNEFESSLSTLTKECKTDIPPAWRMIQSVDTFSTNMIRIEEDGGLYAFSFYSRSRGPGKEEQSGALVWASRLSSIELDQAKSIVRNGCMTIVIPCKGGSECTLLSHIGGSGAGTPRNTVEIGLSDPADSTVVLNALRKANQSLIAP